MVTSSSIRNPLADVTVQRDVLQVGTAKGTVGRDQIVLAHHFIVGALEVCGCFCLAAIGCQGQAVAVEDLFTGALDDLDEPKVLLDVQRGLR